MLDGTSCAPYGAELACETSWTDTAMATVTLTGGNTYLIAFFTHSNGASMVDPTITISQSYTIDWCNLQWPQTLSAGEGTNPTAYGRLHIAGLTDQSTGPDPDSAVIGEVGVGELVRLAHPVRTVLRNIQAVLDQALVPFAPVGLERRPDREASRPPRAVPAGT